MIKTVSSVEITENTYRKKTAEKTVEKSKTAAENVLKKTVEKTDAFINAPKTDSDYFRIPKVLKK